jgi:hypothetical protein
MFGNGNSNQEKKQHPVPTDLSSEFIKEHPYSCELPDGSPIYFSQAELNFFEIFFSSKKYPQYKNILDKFCEDPKFEDLQTEVNDIIQKIDIDIRRDVMSSIVGESCQFILISSLWRELVSYQFP